MIKLYKISSCYFGCASRFRWQHHIRTCITRIFERRKCEYVNKHTSLLLYKSLVVLYMDYFDTVYIVANECDLKNLQLIQNTSCRCILLADKRTSTTYMHAELNLFKLSDRRKLHFQIECYKNVTNSESSLSKYFILSASVAHQHTQNIDSNCMHIPDIRSVMGHKAFCY